MPAAVPVPAAVPGPAAGSEPAAGSGSAAGSEPAATGRLVPISARNLTRGTVLAADVEIATSFWSRFMGLMGRNALLPGHGLWLPGNGIHMFFMRFAIDAVFLGKRAADGSRPIVGLSAGLPPWTGFVPLVRGAEGVLELPAGSIRSSGCELGDRVSLG
ncbi:MAG: DUF192 domain-containing protein [Chloroflexi bacterium]|nr:DUF192 domain-containing protein [Chloroflexota bacterium]